MQKAFKKWFVISSEELLPKRSSGHILRPSLAPPYNKVSQVEIEAGDCEGRLPLLFCQRSEVRGQRSDIRGQSQRSEVRSQSD
jgi:hypothetical protein